LKKHIPNAFTCGNLCAAARAWWPYSSQRTPDGFLPDRRGGVLDFLDGFLARLLKAYSPIGKELDSLADMVTFGLLPSIIISA
jgi:CDP-diacylglycerol--serine O-phosphatidyltransferase